MGFVQLQVLRTRDRDGPKSTVKILMLKRLSDAFSQSNINRIPQASATLRSQHSHCNFNEVIADSICDCRLVRLLAGNQQLPISDSQFSIKGRS